MWDLGKVHGFFFWRCPQAASAALSLEAHL